MRPHPGLYVHFPWCVRKCPYCDFNSHPMRDDVDQAAYADALIEDLGAQTADRADVAFATVFFGGGTPSLFHPRHLGRLLDTARLEPSAEVTLEANPGTHEHADFGAYRNAGVNRLSIGAQSFDDAKLAALGRIHSAEETESAFRKARAAGFDNVNLDLMWGLPGQRTAQALADLERAIALEPEHVSWYQLTIEPKTEFARRPPVLPAEDTLAAIEAAGEAVLERHGYQRYEVSAYARDGRACAHNRNYWRFGDYVGVGAGAHGKVTEDRVVIRTEKPRQPRLYQQNPTRTDRQILPRDAVALEFLMNALRLTDGVSWAEFRECTGLDEQAIAPPWRELADLGLVRPDRCATTREGLRYLDSVLARLA